MSDMSIEEMKLEIERLKKINENEHRLRASEHEKLAEQSAPLDLAVSALEGVLKHADQGDMRNYIAKDALTKIAARKV